MAGLEERASDENYATGRAGIGHKMIGCTKVERNSPVLTRGTVLKPTNSR